MSNPLMWLYNALFGCNHHRMLRVYARPCNIEHYQVCPDCGKEFDYDWAGMRIIGESQRPNPRHADKVPENIRKAQNQLKEIQTEIVFPETS